MKNSLLLLLIVFISSCSCQKKATNDVSNNTEPNFVINQKLDSQTGKEIVLTKVVNDSRCPEGVQCIWAGEVIVEVSVYQDNKEIEKETLTFTPKNQEEMVAWFTQRLPKTEKPLLSVGVEPYPKKDTPIKFEDYFIKLEY